jgi:8-oxo-dGTP diphosphatase
MSEAVLQIAIVHRTRYADWALPKGKLKRGETWMGAAVREVREETGYGVVAIGFAGEVRYQTVKGQKVVRFWNMRSEGVAETAVNPDEIAAMVWLTAPEAVERMTYAIERQLVETWRDRVQDLVDVTDVPPAGR